MCHCMASAVAKVILFQNGYGTKHGNNLRGESILMWLLLKPYGFPGMWSLAHILLKHFLFTTKGSPQIQIPSKYIWGQRRFPQLCAFTEPGTGLRPVWLWQISIQFAVKTGRPEFKSCYFFPKLMAMGQPMLMFIATYLPFFYRCIYIHSCIF